MNPTSSNSLNQAVNANDKVAMLKRIQEQQTQAYNKRKTVLMGNRKPGEGMTSMALGGAMTLEQMNLDRKEQFQGDEYNPFNFDGKTSVDLSLTAANQYMVKENTIGNKLWTPEQLQKKAEAEA